MNLKNNLTKTLQRFGLFYGQSMTLTIGLILFIGVAMVFAVFLFINSAAPDTLTIASGPPGSTSQKNAEKYKAILAKEGITLKILPSEGSADNLKKLLDPKINVDVGFVLGGDMTGINTGKLMSLGSVAYQPLMIFYRGKPKTLLSAFSGQQLDIGQDGSGSKAIALTLLKANGIEPGGDTSFVSTPEKESVKALIDGRIDALFMMGDSSSTDLMKQLIHTPNINLFNMVQADGYSRRFNYLNKLILPEGAIDFGKNVPAEDLYLVGPTVELIARERLHPALSDALLEAAREVHSTPNMFRKRGEFPAPLEHDIRISPDAARFYATGKSFLYRTFPFWVASLVSRILAAVVPLALLLIPGLKLAPAIYRWRVQSRIYPWYKTLLELERDAFDPAIDKKGIEQLLLKLDNIEHKVNKIKIPASFGDLFYSLRGHIGFVRNQLLSVKPRA